jgi:hypothetical protein
VSITLNDLLISSHQPRHTWRGKFSLYIC